MNTERRHRDRRSTGLDIVIDLFQTQHAIYFILTLVSGGLLAILWVIDTNNNQIKRNLIRLSHGYPLENMSLNPLLFVLAALPWVGLLVILSNIDWNQLSFLIEVLSK